MSALPKLRASAILIALIFCNAALAQDDPGQAITPDDMKQMQKAADKAYTDGHFADAFNLFHEKLATHGDAYSQHITGFMLLHGQGTERNPAQGVAWMRLAADNGNRKLVKAARAARRSLTSAETNVSDAYYLELEKQYSDCALLAKLIENTSGQIEASTGSRLPQNVNRVTILYGDEHDREYQRNQRIVRDMLRTQRSAYRKGCRDK